MQRLTYAPLGSADPGALNMFRGFGPVAGGPALSPERVAALVAPWRAIGLQLCEGDEVKWGLLEQWLAHIVQFPGQRSNISFAFVGGRQGTFKGTFFAPVMRILGLHNCFMSADIHHFVNSSHNKTRLAGQLLCVYDEGDPKATRLFQAQIKETVTATDATIWLARNVPYEKLPAMHRLVVLSNQHDGLAVDIDSGNRRFVLYEPTSVFAPVGGQSLSPQARTRFVEEYIRRYVGDDSERGPDDVECMRALHQHLKEVVQVTHGSTAEWEKALETIMRGYKPGSRTPPDHVRFLHDLTAEAFYEGAPLIAGSPADGVIESKGVPYEHPRRQPWEDEREYDERKDDQAPDPDRDRSWHRYVITKKLLYERYQSSPHWPRPPATAPTQNKFTLDVGAFFCQAAALRADIYGMINTVDAEEKHEVKVHPGDLAWRFRTQCLRSVLLQAYPELEHSKSRAKVIAQLEQDIMGGSMFPPLGQQQA